jgi:hypothetical protein
MRSAIFLLLVSFASIMANTVYADDEASNVAHVAAGPYGRCYAKSVPIHDPDNEVRQQGSTQVFLVNDTNNTLVHKYDWFSQILFVKCSSGTGVTLVRVGPWHRGHNPRADHLAIAFYNNGKLLKQYSSLDIAGNEPAEIGSFSTYKNVSASVSHYTVFKSGPEMVKVTSSNGAVYREDWEVRAKTIDGRLLVFDIATGEFRK